MEHCLMDFSFFKDFQQPVQLNDIVMIVKENFFLYILIFPIQISVVELHTFSAGNLIFPVLPQSQILFYLFCLRLGRNFLIGENFFTT